MGVSGGTAYIDIGANFKPFEAQINGLASSRIGRRMESIGKSLTRNLTVPLVAVGAGAAKLSLDFKRNLTLVDTQAGGTTKEVKKLGDQILKLTAKGRFAQGPNELVQALFHIESTGYRGAKAMKVLKAASDLSTVGNADMESTTNALVGAMKTGVKGTENMRKAIGLLNASIGAGNLKMEDLNGAIGTGFLSRAKAVGLTLQDAGAALGELTSQSVGANSAATRLQMTFSLLAAPTEKAQGVLKGIGIDSEELAKKMRGPNGLVSALKLLQDHMAGMTKTEQTRALSEAFGGGKSSGTIITLLGNLDDLNKKYIEIGKNAGNFNEGLEETNKDPGVKLEKAWSKLQSALTQLGNHLLPAVIPVIKQLGDDVSSVAEKFHDLSPNTQKWIVKIGIAVAALGPLLSIGGKLLKVYGAVSTAIRAAGVATGVLEATTATTTAGSGMAAGTATIGAAGSVAAGAGAARSGLLARLGLTEGAASAVLPVTIAVVGSVVADKALKKTTGERTARLIEGGPSAGIGLGSGIEDIEALFGGGSKHKTVNPAWLKIRESFRKAMVNLSVDAIAGMGKINADLERGLSATDKLWDKGTKPWRQHTAQAMGEAVTAIRVGITDGTISAHKGHDEIGKLLSRIHLTKGDDPFGLAQATTKSFEQANRITASGVKTWIARLAEMPSASRKSSINSTTEMLRAWGQGHPRIEHEIDSLTAFQIRKFGATNKQLREGVQKGATGPVAEAFHELATGVGGALENIGVNTNTMLKALGVKSMVKFDALVLGPSHMPQLRGQAAADAHHHPKFAKGGFVVPGQGEGDSFRTAVPHGSFVLNKKATRGFGFQSGGHVPVVLEPQERVFTPSEVKLIGLHNLMAMNESVPRFAKGGKVEVSGPGKLAGIGHSALAKVTDAASRFLAKHAPKPTAGPRGTAHGPKGIGTYKGVPMANWVIRALQYAAGKGIDTTPTSGYRSHAKNVSEGRDYTSEHEFTQYPRGAVDFGGIIDLAALPIKMAVVNATRDFKYPLLAPIGFRDDGHASGTGHQLGGRVRALRRLAGGGWVTVGSTLDPTSGQAPTYSDHNGMSFAELLVAGANAGLKSEALYRVLGIPQSSSYPYGMPMGTAILARRGDQGPVKLWKNDVGSGQTGDPHYKIDLHSAAMNALGASGNKDIEVAKLGMSATAGAAGTKTEKVPAVFHGAKTGNLSFGSTPKSLHGVEKELRQRRTEVKRYRVAAAAATGKPQIQHAIQGNVTALESRIRQLEHARAKLRREAAQKKFTKRLGKKLAKITGFEDLIAGKERIFDIKSQYAEQLVDLEPLAPELPETATDVLREAAETGYAAQYAGYIWSKEQPAYQSLLSAAADWRNAILLAEQAAAGRWQKGKGIGGLEGRWESDILSLEHQIDYISGLPNTHTDKWWHEHPKALKHLHEQLATLPMLRFKEREERKVLGEGREQFYPGGASVLRPNPPLAGSGSLEEALTNVQGIHWPDQHELVDYLPAGRLAGAFGGVIWDVQGSIGELGLKIRDASASIGGSGSGSEGKSEREALLEEMVRQSNQRELLRGIEERVSSGMPKVGSGFQVGGIVMPPYAGKAHAGAIVPGPSSQEKTMVVKGREGIFTEEQMAAMGGDGVSIGDVKVHVHGDIISSHPDPVEVLINDRRFPAEVRKITDRDGHRETRGAGRGLARAGVFG